MSETLSKQVNYAVGSLIKFIEFGTLGPPLSGQSAPVVQVRTTQGEGNATRTGCLAHQ